MAYIKHDSSNQDPKVDKLAKSHRWSLRRALNPEFIALIQPKYFKAMNKYDEIIEENGLFASIPILAVATAVVSFQTPRL